MKNNHRRELVESISNTIKEKHPDAPPEDVFFALNWLLVSTMVPFFNNDRNRVKQTIAKETDTMIKLIKFAKDKQEKKSSIIVPNNKIITP